MERCGLLNGVVTLERCLYSSEAKQCYVSFAKATMHEKSFFIVNIYAPIDYRDQDNFIRTLSEQLMANTNTSNVLIAGDWNTTLNPIDKRGGQPWKATNYRNSLVNLMDELNLIDIYRQIHPTTKSFSYESTPLNLKSRINFLVILRSISSCVKNVEIRASIAHERFITGPLDQI